MPRAAIYAVLLLAIATPVALGQVSRNNAIVNAMRQSDRSLGAVKVWHRAPLDEDMDLVVAIGARDADHLGVEFNGWAVLWEKVGVFLQNRSQPGRVYTITVANGKEDCAARVLRATATDTVISCTGEKFTVHANQKFVYDIRAKRLVRHFEYMPFGGYQIAGARADAVRLLGRNGERQVAVDIGTGTPEIQLHPLPPALLPPGWPELSSPPSETESAPFGPSGAFRLVEDEDSDSECPFRERSIVERRGQRQQRHHMPPSMCDRIGPWAIDGNRFWFGKTFYSGEGNTGTGGFGYFDADTRRFTLLAPHAVTRSAASAILIQPDAIWLALAYYGEYNNTGRGVVRYDRRAQTTSRFDIGGSVGLLFTSFADRVVLAVEDGIIIFRGNEMNGYIVDQTTDGRLRIAQAFK
jgi:hypothetical protein